MKHRLINLLLLLSICSSFIHTRSKYFTTSSVHHERYFLKNPILSQSNSYVDRSMSEISKSNKLILNVSDSNIISKSLKFTFMGIVASIFLNADNLLFHSTAVAETSSSSMIFFNPPPKQISSTVSVTPPDVLDILKDRIVQLRSDVTGEKVNQLRVGESLVTKLRDIDNELDTLQTDIFKDSVDWDVVSIYPKILRAFSPLFTAYTDRAFPTNSDVSILIKKLYIFCPFKSSFYSLCLSVGLVVLLSAGRQGVTLRSSLRSR